MTLMSEQLIVADTQLGKASNQNGHLDAGMLSSPIVDSQLSADLPSDLLSLLNPFTVSAPTGNLCVSATNHST